jgi:phosphatidylserine/phosphatidylglycerophosphate/cardiolipin synthase-like enzyme
MPHRGGVKAEVVLDRSQRTEKYSSADFLAHAGVPVYIDSAHAIAHNKVMIIDRATIITGSFNFTRAAEEKNSENLLIIKGNSSLVERYSSITKGTGDTRKGMAAGEGRRQGQGHGPCG